VPDESECAPASSDSSAVTFAHETPAALAYVHSSAGRKSSKVAWLNAVSCTACDVVSCALTKAGGR